MLRLAIGIAAFLAIMWLGIFVLRALANPAPPPSEGDLRKVDLRYRCVVCASEVKMTLASEDLPEPPRHCMEDMELVTPVE